MSMQQRSETETASPTSSISGTAAADRMGAAVLKMFLGLYSLALKRRSVN